MMSPMGRHIVPGITVAIGEVGSVLNHSVHFVTLTQSKLGLSDAAVALLRANISAIQETRIDLRCDS